MIRVFNQYVSTKNLLLVVQEAILIFLGLTIGAGFRFAANTSEFRNYTQMPKFALEAVIVVVVVQVCFYWADLYSIMRIRHRKYELLNICEALGGAFLVLGVLYYAVPSMLLGRGVFFIGMAVSSALVITTRAVMEQALPSARPHRRILIVGTGELAAMTQRELIGRSDLRVEVVGAVTEREYVTKADEFMSPIPILGDISTIEAVAREHRITHIVVALSDRRGFLPTRELVRLRVQGIRIEDAHATISSLTGRVSLKTVKPSWFIFCEGFRRSRPTVTLKRGIDIAVSLMALLITAPIMMIVCIAIKLDSRGPIIYRQTRVGNRDEHFNLLKFRSMRVDAEAHQAPQWAVDNDPRITRVGAVLRKYRLDELPQFLNILGGQMSVVGPRPERPSFVAMLRDEIPYYDERHSVRPGLTGWAQVRYGYGASVEDALRKLEYDLFYLQNMSIWFDVAILFATVRVVITGHGSR
jgi:sugar transferase (PEP-CTERM system associated)